ncbi:Mechanosensitive ion channel protein Msy1-like protein [Elsinoe fawcettii]|nr:Mechanosensitive ion channel protein Msy1-like protein [Elsinoe fawcettii]
MTTPIEDKGGKSYVDTHNQNGAVRTNSHDRSDEEGTVIGDNNGSFKEKENHTRLDLDHLQVPGQEPELEQVTSRSRVREEAHRLGDDLAMLKAEQQVQEAIDKEGDESMRRTRSRRDDTVDEFDVATNPVHEKAQVYNPIVVEPTNKFAVFVKKVHQSSWLVRYFTYIIPVVLILLIPLLLGALVFKDASVGDVELVWFMIWLEIVWLTLWAGRLLAKCLPWPIGIISSLFTNNSKKWRDMGKQLELPATLFFWWLAIEISFLPTMTNHRVDGRVETSRWMTTMNKVLVSIFVGAILNFVEKIIIQLIAISFHLRTYQDRIEINKFQIGSLAKLYEYSKTKITMEDSEFENPSMPGSGARTPGAFFNEATKQTKQAVNKFGDVAGKIAGDFTGKSVLKSSHPQQVVLQLLNSTSGSQVLARRLYRTFAREDTQTVHQDDLTAAFSNEEEATAAFGMFDKDMNGDISMEELEAVCVEIGRERKSITASLKDLDSVVSKLDDVFMFVVAIIVILVFISLISSSAATAITSAGSALLALSWLFSATAQEFLQSVIFVFVKHPFDVGDRVSVYGNTGALGKGDDYFVKEISLLYTEFKKMEGHIVQAPNSYLNTLFILNQRRSGGLAEAVPVTFKYGTTLEQIEGLRSRLLEFVKSEKREYQSNILTELREVSEAHAITLNVVFFYKSNWQNEGLRLARRNKFICALMVTMQELDIQGPRMRYPGMTNNFPLYTSMIPHVATPGMGYGGHPDNPQGIRPEQPQQPQESEFVPPPSSPGGVMSADFNRHTSFRAPSRRQRAESFAAMNRRVDFSLGAQDASTMDSMADVYEDRNRSRLPPEIREVSASRERESTQRASEDAGRTSQDLARTTSRSGPAGHGLARRSTDTNRSVHRNRFFGRHRSGTLQEGVEREYLMESGLADVPEAHVAANTAGVNGVAGQGIAGVQRQGTLDPRTGHVSNQAMRSDEHIRPVGRSQTEDWEMRRL